MKHGWTWVLVLLISSLAAPSVSAQDTVPYREKVQNGHRLRIYSESKRVQTPELTYRVIQVQRGDSLSKLAAQFFWPVLHELNKDQVEDPNRIYPRQWLVVPSVRAPVIRVEPVEKFTQKVLAGVVYASEGAVRFQTGEDEVRLSVGDDIVGTGRLYVDAGFATIRMMDGAQLRIYPYSSVDLRAIPDKGEDAPVSLSLVRGRLLFAGPDTGKRKYRIVTPVVQIAGVAGLLGARVDTDSGVQVENYNGKTAVWVNKKRVDVPAGHGFVSNVEGSDWDVRTLPEPTDSMSAELSPDTPEVTFRWRPIRGAAGYLLTIARDPDMTGILTRTIVPSTPEYTMGLYNAGEYFWRVQVVDEAGLTGPWSATQQLIVGEAQVGNAAAQ